MLNDLELLKLFLPELLIEYFEIVKLKEENKILHIYFEEKIHVQIIKTFCLVPKFCT